MFVSQELAQRAREENPVRVGLIGAGKFGSMFMSQVPTTAGLTISVIADLDPERARNACRTVGWSEERIAATVFMDDAQAMLARDDVDVTVEATEILLPAFATHVPRSRTANMW